MTSQISAVPKTPIVQLINNKPMTSSLDVAATFEKQHKDVLRAIERLEIPDDFNQRNFAPVEYHDAKGEKRPAYNMTRDGFVILVMGFTGKKALAFKIAYINAFNAMEAQLSGKQQPALDAPATKEQRKPLVNLVNALISVAPLSYRDAWHMVHAQVNGKTAKEMTCSEIQAAIAFVQRKIDQCCVRPLPDPNPKPKNKIYDFDNAIKVNKEISNAAYNLGSSFAIQIEKLEKQFRRSFNHAERLSNVAGDFDCSMMEQGRIMKKTASIVFDLLLMITKQADSMTYLAKAMKDPEHLGAAVVIPAKAV